MDWPDLDTGTCRAAISLPQLGHPRFTRACLDESVIGARRPEVREFVPFDDRWFDDDPPGALVPLPANFTCVHAGDGAFHWVPAGTSGKVITSPVRKPSSAAVPAFSSST